VTRFTNGNEFQFQAIGAATPALWHGLTIFVIAINQDSGTVRFNTKSPGLGPGSVPVSGSGANNGIFSKIAMPLGNGWSAGILLSHEISSFNVSSVADPSRSVRYETVWRPSGGFGIAWQPNDKLITGIRLLSNADLERRIDSTRVAEGIARSNEFRIGVSAQPWQGAWFDVGATRLEKSNGLAGSHTVAVHPNLGFEHWFSEKRFAFRCGLDETSPTVGFSWKFAPFNLDVVYVRNIAKARSELFGSQSNSLVASLSVDYDKLFRKR
jgi:hypothetical protein